MKPTFVLALVHRWKLPLKTPIKRVQNIAGFSDKDWDKLRRTVNEVRKQHTHDVHERMSLQGENKVIHGVNTSWDKTGLPAVSEEIVSWLINAFRIDNWPQRMLKYSREEWKDKFTTQHSLDAETGYRVLLEHVRTVVAMHVRELDLQWELVFMKDVADDIPMLMQKVRLLLQESGLPEISDAYLSFLIKRRISKAGKDARSKVKAVTGSAESDAVQASPSRAPTRRAQSPPKNVSKRTKEDK